MSDKKIKVLIVPSDTMGVGHFRSIWPAQCMEEHFGDEIDVEINTRPAINNIEYLKQFDIVHFHRHLGPYEKAKELFPQMREAGITLVMDIDDFWEPPSTHPLYEIVKKDKMSEKITGNLKLVDYVTTTTKVFGDYIKKYNDNIKIIPNALNMEHRMWTSETYPNPTDRCRISWIGGSSHLHDLELLRTGMQKLWSNNELEDKFQIVMCGFDTRGTITEFRKKPNGQDERHTRNIEPHETVWRRFEDIFTASGLAHSKPPINMKDWTMGRELERTKDEDYWKWLDKIKKPKKSDYKEGQYAKNYVRRWTLPLTQYGKHYDYCDVCLAPLIDTWVERVEHVKPNGQIALQNIKRKHVFNEVKSELKIIEAGMKGKVLIAQDFGIYSELLEDGKTGLLVKDDKKDWYKHMKTVIEDPVYRQELADNLHDYVKDRYEIKNVTADRVQFYKQIVKEKKAKSELTAAK